VIASVPVFWGTTASANGLRGRLPPARRQTIRAIWAKRATGERNAGDASGRNSGQGRNFLERTADVAAGSDQPSRSWNQGRRSHFSRDVLDLDHGRQSVIPSVRKTGRRRYRTNRRSDGSGTRTEKKRIDAAIAMSPSRRGRGDPGDGVLRGLPIPC